MQNQNHVYSDTVHTQYLVLNALRTVTSENNCLTITVQQIIWQQWLYNQWLPPANVQWHPLSNWIRTGYVQRQLSDINCLTSTVWDQLSDINCLTSTNWHQLSDINSQTSTVRHQLSDINIQPSTVRQPLYNDNNPTTTVLIIIV